MLVARPVPMARKMSVISREEPGTERKRTRLNAPSTATPVPTFPLTMRMTACTTTGSVTSEAANPLLHWPVSMAVMAMSRPQAAAQSISTSMLPMDRP